MAIEYDLVILGGTPEGLAAVERAVQFGARVALILQGLDGRRSPLQTQGILYSMQAPVSEAPADSPLTAWQGVIQQANLVAESLTQEDLQRLMVMGCDVIAETGWLVSDRPLRLATPSRRLTTRALLLATGTRPQPPAVPGLADIPYDTPATLLQRDTPPDEVVVLGESPLGLALCQLLRRWGVAVTLINPHPQLLNQEDVTVSNWMTAQLRAEGVDLRLGTMPNEVALEGNKITLAMAKESITTHSLVVTTTVPNLAEIGLEPELNGDRPLVVNAFLQTLHPRIFACGTVLGGYDAPAIAHYEAQIAVENALFWNRRRIDYCSLPYDLPTHPPMARVGLTEAQARRHYDPDQLLVAHQPLYEHPQAQWRASTTGFCKLIAHRNGSLLGVHGVGPEAGEWVQAIAWSMNQNVSWRQIAQNATLPNSLMTLLQQTAQQWEDALWQPGQWRRNWTENWCNWRRSR